MPDQRSLHGIERKGKSTVLTDVWTMLLDFWNGFADWLAQERVKNLFASLAYLLTIAASLYALFRWFTRSPPPIVGKTFSENEGELIAALNTAYVGAVYRAHRPSSTRLGEDDDVKTALMRLHSEKIATHSGKIILPVACHRMNPLCDHCQDLLNDLNGSLAPGTLPYKATYVDSHIYVGAVDLPAEMRTAPQLERFLTSAGLVVASLGALQDLFFREPFFFSTVPRFRFISRSFNQHVARAATAIAADANVQKAALSVVLEMLAKEGSRVAFLVPKRHPVAAVLAELLRSHVERMVPEDLYSIPTSMPKERMWPQRLPDKIKREGFETIFFEDLLALDLL